MVLVLYKYFLGRRSVFYLKKEIFSFYFLKKRKIKLYYFFVMLNLAKILKIYHEPYILQGYFHVLIRKNILSI